MPAKEVGFPEREGVLWQVVHDDDAGIGIISDNPRNDAGHDGSGEAEPCYLVAVALDRGEPLGRDFELAQCPLGTERRAVGQRDLDDIG